MFTIACCLVAEFGSELDLVSGWKVVMHTCLRCAWLCHTAVVAPQGRTV